MAKRMSPPLTSPRQRSAASVGRADLLRVWQQCGADDTNWPAMAALLGFEAQDRQPSCWHASDRQGAGDEAEGGDAPKLPGQVPVSNAESHPGKAPLRATLYGVTAHTAYTPESDLSKPPDVAAAGAVQVFSHPLRADGRAAPEMPLLVPARRMASYLRRCLRQRGPSNRLDVACWVEQVARAHPVRVPPRQHLPGWHHGSVLLIDHHRAMAPLFDDCQALVAQAWRASAGQVKVFWRTGHGELLQAVAGAGAPGWRPVAALPKGTARYGLVVAATQSGEQAEGAALLQGLLRRGGRGHRLLAGAWPGAEAWKQGWLHGWSHTRWDHGALLKPGDCRPVSATTQPAQAERLLAALALTVRFEPVLLRALRLHLGLPVDAETEVWGHPDALVSETAGCISPGRRAHHAGQLLQLFDEPQRQALARLVEAHHRHLSPMVQMEEEALAMQYAPGARNPSEAWARAAHTLQHAPDSDAAKELARYVSRTAERVEGQPEVWAQHPALAETWLRANAEAVRQGQAMPQGMPPQVVMAVMQDANAPSGRRPWHLVHRGEALWLAPMGDLPQGAHELATVDTRPWPLGGVLVSHAGQQRWVGLPNPADEGSRLPQVMTDEAPNGWLPLGSAMALSQGSPEQAPWHVRTHFQDITVAALPRPSWAEEWGHGAMGIYADVVSPWGERVRMYWRMARFESMRKVLGSHAYGQVGADNIGLYADITVKRVTQRFRWIEPGSFWMGSLDSEPQRDNNEGPRHRVTLTEGFWLAELACTRELWQQVMPAGSYNDGLEIKYESDRKRPAEGVSWVEAQRFLSKLRGLLPGVQATLPTEAQWEYACRAGSETPFSFGHLITPEQVNYDGKHPYSGGERGRYRECSVPGKSLPANAWGLHEMHGNVWEWCRDGLRPYGAEPVVDPVGSIGVMSEALHQDKGLAEQDGVPRCLRGGSWFCSAGRVRSALRACLLPSNYYGQFGFRIALTLFGPSSTAHQGSTGARTADDRGKA